MLILCLPLVSEFLVNSIMSVKDGPVVKMDVDCPSSLKRSNSAPMINDINNTISGSQCTPLSRENQFNVFLRNVQPRFRRFSTSGSPNIMPNTSPKLVHRVNQLRQEETIDLINREVAHEREIHSAMQISQSWEDLSIMIDSPSKVDVEGQYGKQPGSRSSLYDPLHLNLSMASAPSSPSPTRSLRHCVSPSLFKPNLSPSPTRKTFTSGSLSPISMRPSALGPVKRKCEMDDYEPITKKWGLLITNTRPEPMQVSGIVPTTMDATLVTESICSSSGDSSNSNHSFSFRPLQTLMDESKTNSQ
ncbi:P2R1A-PPP2R2A-interacting phosphatase regulator 1 isoform X2 [Daktulosphaira vitifoliae]|uniref:P2R1A-PPP2R2A-interacting phosphatase regulator 1 isoform X2 n=1 Tax=Daktulosphaira vitifoliae TaxID=58002 RepID=UPI0021AAB86C|nr:P2R1A-PPP2R2A-interacting phosphatase regulator 1 isoform X2 [Daktulosphaira vitifoliae]